MKKCYGKNEIIDTPKYFFIDSDLHNSDRDSLGERKNILYLARSRLPFKPKEL